MAPQEIQALVDAEEADVSARYDRLRRMASMLDDAAKRADAVSRLEAWLRLHPMPHTNAA